MFRSALQRRSISWVVRDVPAGLVMMLAGAGGALVMLSLNAN